MDISPDSWIPCEHLWNYLTHTSAVSVVQVALLALIVHLVSVRSFRRLGWGGDPLAAAEAVANEFIQGLTQLNVGLGLLLTFSGVYGYIGAGQEDDGWSLLLALGSSALGYSAYAVCAVGPIVDGMRQERPAALPAEAPAPCLPQPVSDDFPAEDFANDEGEA